MDVRSSEFWKKWGLYVGSMVFAIILIVIAIYMSVPEELKVGIFDYFTSDEDGKQLTIGFLISLVQLIFLAVFVKVLLAQRVFLDAIYEHFKSIFIEKNIVKHYSEDEIQDIAKKVNDAQSTINIKNEDLQDVIYRHFKTVFIEKSFAELYNKDELLKIAKNASTAHGELDLHHDKLKSISIKQLEDLWEKGDKKNNTITTESIYTTTLYSTDDTSGHEIMHRKIYLKMMRDGHFKFNYYFIPPDEIINIDDYDPKSINANMNRWKEKSYKCIANNVNDSREIIKIKSDFAVDKDNKDIDWIGIKISSDEEHQEEFKKGEEIVIQFSLSNPIDLTDSDCAIERRKKYFETTYDTPHAVRSMAFQIETYNNENLNFEPSAVADGKLKKEIPVKSIYYDSWSWKFYYSEMESKEIKINVGNKN